MKIGSRFLCFILGLFLGSGILFGNTNYQFEKISPESGFAFDAVYAISEDCNGFVWFGCNNGLYYYNTTSIEKVDLLSDEKDNSHSLAITDILHDEQCRLWICTDEGLFRRNELYNSYEKLSIYSKDSAYSADERVQQIMQFDDELYMILIGGNLFYFYMNENILYRANIGLDGPFAVSLIKKDAHGNLLIGTTSGHLLRGNHPTDTFNLFYYNEYHSIESICDDNTKYYIGYNNKGVDVVNSIGEKISELNRSSDSKIPFPDNRIRDILKADNGEIWIGTYRGIVIINKEGSSIVTNDRYNGLPHNSIYTLEKGKNGGIWIGTWAGGIAYYNEGISRFNHVVKVPNEKEIKSVISSFIEDQNGNVWIGSEQAGINIYNVNEGDFDVQLTRYLKKIPRRIKSLARIDEERIVIGTFYNGIWIYDQSEQSVERISQNTVLENAIISTITASNDELWIGLRGARHSMFRYSFDSGQFEAFDIMSESVNRRFLWVWKVLLDSSKKLWVCTEEGLYCKYSNDTVFQKCFTTDSIFGLNNTFIYTIYEDDDEQIWIGTKGKGLFVFDPVTDKVSEIKNDSYLAGNDVFGIVEDKINNIWFSTDNGVFQYQKESKGITRYSTVDGLPGDQFNPNSILRISTGEVFFGSSNGFSYIDPTSIKFNERKPKIVLTNLLINNQQFEKAEEIKANSFIVEEIESITLSHQQNSLTFIVASNNFIKSHKNRFRYRLDNYDDDWIEVEQNRMITYTKIPPGDYTLEVYGSNNDNVWSEEPLLVQIKINSPFWQTWYAFLFYTIVVALVVGVIIRQAALRFKLKKEILAERFKGEAQEQLYAEKMKFFTNISHEFRTPLTLIISPLENLLRKFKYDDRANHQLQTIKRNSSRLLRLTNQILDYRLLEVDKLKAKCVNSDIVDICYEVIQCFDLQLNEKNINLIFTSEFKELFVQVDPDMIEKIVYNLLSNAIKFSSDKGQIFVSIERCEQRIDNQDDFYIAGKSIEGPRVEIKVRDFGKGINKSLLSQITERFSTVNNGGESGTGIGLHLSQEYAMLHDGNIMFTSEEGQGSTFILNIPFKEDAVFKEKTFIKQLTYDESPLIEAASNAQVKSKKAVVLLAEDNDELRIYLKNYLQDYYKVVTAKNGEQAYEIAVEVLPDIVITDILMPHSDGIELTQKLKSNPNTNHISVIVLTALSEVEYQKESLMKGVESYLIKPVDETLLLAQVENILNKRIMIEKHYTEDRDAKKPQMSGGGSIIDRAEKIVEQNLQNVSFDMNMLIDELNVSRSTFHRKIKKGTSQSPSEFIRDIRLKYAIKMMKSGNYNIDEIGSYIGFNSTSYFIRSFKKKYGKTPNEYYKSVKH